MVDEDAFVQDLEDVEDNGCAGLIIWDYHKIGKYH